MREKFPAETLSLQPWSCIAWVQCADKLCFYNFSYTGDEKRRQKVAYRNSSCLFIAKLPVATGSPVKPVNIAFVFRDAAQ